MGDSEDDICGYGDPNADELDEQAREDGMDEEFIPKRRRPNLPAAHVRWNNLHQRTNRMSMLDEHACDGRGAYGRARKSLTSPSTMSTPAILVADLRQLNPKVSFALYAQVVEIADKTANNNSAYRLLGLKDRTGTVTTSVFENLGCYADARELQEGDVVLVDGNADYFKESPAPRLARIQRLAVDSLDPAVADCVFETSPVPVKNLLSMLESGYNSIKHPGLQKVVRNLTSDPRFLTAQPSADGNRPYRRGLLEYLCASLESLPALFTVYPFVDRDVVYASLLTYSLGRTVTASASGGERTALGLTHGSSIISYAMFRREALLNKLPDSVIQAVEAVILSCSVKTGGKPATPEAVLVNLVLDLHESMGIVARARYTTEGEVSNYMKGLGTALAFLPPTPKASETPPPPPPPPPAQ